MVFETVGGGDRWIKFYSVYLLLNKNYNLLVLLVNVMYN